MASDFGAAVIPLRVSAGLIFDKKHRFESALGRSAKTTI
jgi:hypothetical protein